MNILSKPAFCFSTFWFNNFFFVFFFALETDITLVTTRMKIRFVAKKSFLKRSTSKCYFSFLSLLLNFLFLLNGNLSWITCLIITKALTLLSPRFFWVLSYEEKEGNYLKQHQGDLNKKEIQLNLCNIFSFFIFNELYYLSNDSKSRKARARSYYYEITCWRSLFNITSENFNLE